MANNGKGKSIYIGTEEEEFDKVLRTYYLNDLLLDAYGAEPIDEYGSYRQIPKELRTQILTYLRKQDGYYEALLSDIGGRNSISFLHRISASIVLRECSLLMELPPQIGVQKKLNLFDLEGTKLTYLPKEIGKLETLECLRVSLSTNAYEHKDRSGIEHILPRMTISKLKELFINVNLDAE
ncbi:WRKY domain, Leucine-rich repeat domain, L domain-like protein [Artemisia annua]|uniref:WRKY domain, Leucine-rich repeat domain, L domain-like protein n=1 Tax=Artemisia annua TaxID=35608 RepID=A0A2U1P4W4_ARTAN|nr:WRKY domain, Leucine-rich repeat domain, L domain-like protein [Artemisia annua]